MKKSLVFSGLIALVLSSPLSNAIAKEKLVVYTSMKEGLIGKLGDAFGKKHPDIDFDYYSAGAGKLMAKIAIERQSGKIMADILWTSDIEGGYYPEIYRPHAREIEIRSLMKIPLFPPFAKAR